jgi:hypothetical protein
MAFSALRHTMLRPFALRATVSVTNLAGWRGGCEPPLRPVVHAIRLVDASSDCDEDGWATHFPDEIRRA